MSDLTISSVNGPSGTQALQFQDFTSAPADSNQPSGNAAFGRVVQFVQALLQLLGPLLEAQSGQSPSNPPSGGGCGGGAAGPANGTAKSAEGPPAAAAASPAPSTNVQAATATPSTAAGSNARSVQDAQANTHPSFKPILRGDEAAKDAGIKTQADFGRAVDQTAKEYGLDPNAFRAELQAESAAFTQGFQKAMQLEGDLDRKAENNTSIGMGQISRKFLDGREWSADGPGNARVGSQVVSSADYMNSPTIQMRTAAANIAQRVADKGGVEQGLAYYVSGDSDPNNPKAKAYIDNINKAMNDPTVTDVGRG